MAEDWLDDLGDTATIDKNTFDRLEHDHHTDGYRSGLSAGKEATLQNGFNDGYRQSLEVSTKLACYRGILNGHLCYSLSKLPPGGDTETQQAAIEAVVEELASVEKQVHSLLTESIRHSPKSCDAMNDCKREVDDFQQSACRETETSESETKITIEGFKQISEKVDRIHGDIGCNRRQKTCDFPEVTTVLTKAASLIKELGLDFSEIDF